MTGDELRAALKELDLSQVEFAEQLRCHYTTVYDWSRGERRVPPWIDYVIELMRERKMEKSDGR